jgi:hypothetical protein
MRPWKFCARLEKKTEQERMNIANIHPLRKDFGKNTCRGLAARRIHFAAKRQAQAKNTLVKSGNLPHNAIASSLLF